MDSAPQIVRCFQAAATDAGIPSPTAEAIRHIIGLGLSEALEALLPEHDHATRMRVTEKYREYFSSIDQSDISLFKGVTEGINALSEQGYQLAIATGKSRRGLNRALAQTGLTGFFCATRCADEARSKPHPQMLYDLLDQTDHDVAHAVMVGDTVYDLQMAQTAGMSALGVSYGVHGKAQLMAHAPLACFDTFEEVCRWLK